MAKRKTKRSKRAPRRKAGSSPSKAKRKTTFRLVVEAQEMIVKYTPSDRKDEYAMALFEFKSPHRPPKRIAVSETGYRMHHAYAESVKSARSPQNYAREFVLDCLNTGRRGVTRDHRQMSLFS